MSTKESLAEDVSSTLSDKTKRDDTHILEILLNYDPEDEEDSEYMQVFQGLASIRGIDGVIILSVEDLRILHAHLDKKANGIFPMSNITCTKQL